MIKIISIIFSLGLAVVLAPFALAAPDLNGSWSGFGYSFKASQTGNSLTLIATDGDIKGKVSLEGIITGNIVQGQQIMVAKGCPNLEKYVPVNGTISSDGNSITITYRNSEYDPDKCVDVPGSESEGTGSYTKVSTPFAPTTLPKPTQIPQIKKAAPTPTSPPSSSSVPSVDKVDQLTEKQDQTKKNNLFYGFGIGGEIISDMLAKVIVSFSDSVVELGSEKRTPLEFTPAWFEMKKQQFGKSYEKILDETTLTNQANYQVHPPIFLPGEDKSAGSVKIKVPGNQQSSELTQSQEVPRGSVIETTKSLIFQTNRAIFRITPLPGGGKGVVELGEIPMLREGTLDVIYEKTEDEAPLKIQTPNIELIVIGTQFSVIYNKKESKNSVAVYEGRVEVKTNDGKTTIVTPDGDKPGIVLVTQKLSVWKLALDGFVFTAVIGGAVLFIKRRIKTTRSKETKS